MSNKVEKISLLSEMIAYAHNTSKIKTVEYKFLSRAAKLLNISQSDFQFLINNPTNLNKPLKEHSVRIVQFYKFVKLTFPNSNRSYTETAEIHNFGLKMGLSHESISRILHLMEHLPEGMLPPEDVLVDIFKVQYN